MKIFFEPSPATAVRPSIWEDTALTHGGSYLKNGNTVCCPSHDKCIRNNGTAASLMLLLRIYVQLTAISALGDLDSPMSVNISRAKTALLTCISLPVPSHKMAEVASKPVLTALMTNPHAPMALMTLRLGQSHTHTVHKICADYTETLLIM